MGWCAREDGDMCEGKHVNHMCMYMYRRMLNGLRVQKVVSMTTSHRLYMCVCIIIFLENPLYLFLDAAAHVSRPDLSYPMRVR